MAEEMEKTRLIQDRIIQSLLDTDLYKFKVSYFYYVTHRDVVINFVFDNRKKEMKLGYLAENVKNQLRMMKGMKLVNDEMDYTHDLKLFSDDYLMNFLKGFSINPNLVEVFNDDGQLRIRINGYGRETTMYEIYLLSIVSQLYSMTNHDYQKAIKIGHQNLDQDIALINKYNLWVAEFGTRRRGYREWQEIMVVRLAKECPSFAGTSNMFLAKKHGLKAIGSQPHEEQMIYLALVPPRFAQIKALLDWKRVFPNDTVVLTDTFGTDRFFQDFCKKLAEMYSIHRPDSGDPIEEGEKIIQNYLLQNLDPKTATGLFSDSLTTKKCVEIFLHFTDRLKTLFAMGTHLSNNLGFEAPSIVIKPAFVNGVWVVKISNDSGKFIGDPNLKEEIIDDYKRIPRIEM